MYFELYQDNQNLWRWRLKATNHEIIAHGEGYKNRSDCIHAIDLIKSSTFAEIIEV